MSLVQLLILQLQELERIQSLIQSAECVEIPILKRLLFLMDLMQRCYFFSLFRRCGNHFDGQDAGGTWSGSRNYQFIIGYVYLATAGIGSHTITYSFAGTCGDSDTEIITVNEQSDATIIGTSELCSNSAAVNLNATDAGGTWSEPGITDGVNGTFDLAGSGTGTFAVAYSSAANARIVR